MQSAAVSSALSAPTAAMAGLSLTNTPSADSCSFPFFKLPRELRDTIYGHATRKGDIDAAFCDFHDVFLAGVETAAVPQMLLVSKQFKREYEEEVARSPGSRLANVVLFLGANSFFYADERRWNSAPRDRSSLQKLFRPVTDLKVEYRHGQFLFYLQNLRATVRTFTSFMPNLQTLTLESVEGDDLYEFDDYKEWLETTKTALLHDDNGVRDRDFVTKGATTLSCRLFEPNMQAAAYRRFLQSGYVAMGHMQLLFGIHPGNRTLLRALESNGPHTFDGFEIETDPANNPPSFDEIESDVLAFLELNDGADGADGDILDHRLIEHWAAELEGHYEERVGH